MLDTHPAQSETAWKVTEAKNRFSELLNRADERPQVVTRRGRAYVVLPQETYEALAGARPTLKDLILNGPSLEGVDLERDRSPMREVDFGDAG